MLPSECESIKVLLARADLPAWLQAFAAIIALVISVWAAWRVGADSRRRDNMEARGLAVAIYPEIQKLEIIIKNTQDGLNELVAEHGGKLVGQSVAFSIQEKAPIKIPVLIERNIDKFFLLGEPAGPACLQLVSVLMQYNDFVESIVGRIVIMNADQWVEAIHLLQDHFKLLKGVMEKSSKALRPIYAGVKG